MARNNIKDKNADYGYDSSNYSNNYEYNSDEDNYDQNNSSKKNDKSFLSFLSNKKTFSIFAIILFILFLLVLSLFILPILRPDVFVKYSLKDKDGNDISAKVVRLTSDGNLIDIFMSDGNTLTQTVNPRERTTIILKPNGITDGNIRRVVLVTNEGTRIVLSQDSYTINPDGTITISINPEDDLGVDEEFLQLLQTNPELALSNFTLELTIETTNDAGERETIIYEIPVQFIYSEFAGTGCIEVSRTSVYESTHNGFLEVNVKLRVSCETSDALYSMVNWSTERMGNVEVLFNDYSDGSVIASGFATKLKSSVKVGTYNLKIIYSPLKEFAGKKASFDLLFGSGNSEAKIIFDVVGDNLEQCIRVTTLDSIIESEEDTAQINIDASKCHSEKIEVYLCDGDSTCSFAPEGGINLSQSYFSLSGGNKSRTVSITREEIPGVYGVSVKARIPGLEKNFIDEKEILVKPTTELVYPERFVVSLIGKEVRDVVKVRNKSLSEKVSIETSVCNLYNSSLGVSDAGSVNNTTSGIYSLGIGSSSDSWWGKMYSELDLYSGVGKYQSSIYGNLNQIDSMMQSIQNITAPKNADIKQAYLDIVATNESIDDSINAIDAAITSSQELNEATAENEEFKDTDFAVQVASLGMSCYSLYSTMTGTCVKTTAAELKTKSYAASTSACAQAKPGAEAASAQVSYANRDACGNLLTQTISIYETVNSAKSIYDQIEAISNQDSISAENALEKAEEAASYFEEAKETSTESLNTADLILEYASLDDLTTISDDYYEVKKYLELAKTENATILEKLQSARESFVDADDELTTALGDIPEEWEIYNSFGVLAAQAYDMIGNIIAGQSSLVAYYSLADAQLLNSVTAAKACSGSDCGSCGSIATAGEGVKTYLHEQLAEMQRDKLLGPTVSQAISLTLQSYQTWRALSQDYVDELTDTKEKYTDARDKIDAAIVSAEATATSIDVAIEAADYLARESRVISDASTYTKNHTSLSDDFDQETMTGFIATGVAVGFVNGAYDGGVYTTRDTTSTITSSSTTSSTTSTDSTASTAQEKQNNSSNKIYFDSVLKEDCDNKVKLTLVDYVINLLNDGKEVTVSENNVNAFFSFYELKTFDFYKEQETSLVFTNGGLKKNSYGIVSITVDKHSHGAVANPVDKFGPFNVPDSTKEEVTYKYHFKFNAAPRKTSSTKTSAVCENGLLIGSTGEEALPKVLLSWDWKDITDAKIKDKYLDSTQLSIAISKRLAAFDDFLMGAGTSCPINPGEKIIDTIKPTEVSYTKPSTCYLPLSTVEYEGKPSLYYHLSSLSTQSSSDDYDEFFDGELPTMKEEGLALIDFNAYLIRDGLGLDFQNDFVNEYTRSIMKSSVNFTEPENGFSRYFKNKDKFYFTSESIEYSSKQEFILPDAGLYRIQVLIEFDDPTKPRLFDGGAMVAKIKVVPTLIQPINENYSPLYYTPFDGSVGLNTSNNRTGYGTSLISGENFSITSADGAYLEKDQQKSLVKTKNITIEDFLVLNSLPSRRGRLLEYSYNYSYPANYYNDSNSMFIYSPTTATPLLISMSGEKGQSPVFTYLPIKGSTKLKTTKDNLFLLTGVEGCKDFYGIDLRKTLNKTPDLLLGSYYGVAFNQADFSGKILARTVAYTPTREPYELSYTPGGEIIITNDTMTQDKVPLQGIAGMNYNDIMNNSKISQLSEVFKAVQERNVCVSNISGKEIYWWPEDYLFEKENALDDSLLEKEMNEKTKCIK